MGHFCQIKEERNAEGKVEGEGDAGSTVPRRPIFRMKSQADTGVRMPMAKVTAPGSRSCEGGVTAGTAPPFNPMARRR